jgi:UDP-N-acetylglucosamine 2-epimerase (non-hydrolysing)
VILAIYGTTGELIKLAPVLHRLREREHGYLSATTGQQALQIPAFLDGFGLPQPDVWLARGAQGRDLRTNRDIPGWLARTAASFARERGSLRRELRRGPGRPLVLVHGDTMTTVLGALMGRALGVPVAHVEAGLRSFDLRHPFPEELNRRLTSAIAATHYAPGAWAAGNLRRGRIVDTGSNTVRDSLALAAERREPPDGTPEPPFGIVSLHRFELLNDRPLLTRTLDLLAEHARTEPLVFVDHPVTVAALERYGLGRLFDPERFVRVPRLTFLDFVPLMRRSAFVFTDSGGSQEECFYLDLPCLVHRRTTERQEGLGENVVLSRYDEGVVADFLRDPARFRRTSELADHSPADVIVDDLEAAGFVPRRG